MDALNDNPRAKIQHPEEPNLAPDELTDHEAWASQYHSRPDGQDPWNAREKRAREHPRRATAIHEASHAIVAMGEGVPVYEASIDASHTDDGRVIHEITDARTNTLIVLAGPLGEEWDSPRKMHDPSLTRERTEADDLARQLASEGGIDFEGLLDELRLEVFDAIETNWDSIVRVAVGLVERGTLNTKELQHLARQEG